MLTAAHVFAFPNAFSGHAVVIKDGLKEAVVLKRVYG